MLSQSIHELMRADTLWHKATDALLERNYTRFDEIMHEIKAITKHWTPRDAGAANNRPASE